MKYLRKLRQEKGLSIQKLEAATDVGQITILNIENGKYKTTNEKMKKLADYFGVKPSLLIKNVSKINESKKCLNQRCLLNQECFCQSHIVTTGRSFCKSENEVSDAAVREKNINGSRFTI